MGWISVLGYVFDVRQGAKFYAKGGPYEMLAGRDATKALASGDLKIAHDFSTIEDEEKIEDPLNPNEIAEAQRWLEYFASHQKYKQVGRLPRVEDSFPNIDAIVNKEAETDEKDEYEYIDEGEKTPPKWHPPVLDETADCP